MIEPIVRFSVRRPGIIVALALVLAAFGLQRLFGASLDVFPEFSPVQVVIQTEAPGLSAEQSEVLVTRPIESAVVGVPGVGSLRSLSIPGLSVVTVVFADTSNPLTNRQVISERLTTLTAQLPRSMTPAITPLTSSASTLLGIGLTSRTRSQMDLRSLVDWTLRPQIMSVAGVADVNVFGGEVRQWQIQVRPAALIRHGLALQDVVEAARKVTGVRGAGFIESTNQRIVVAAAGQTLDIAALGRVAVAQRGPLTVRLADVADIVAAPAASISGAAIDGHAGVFLMVQGQLGANTRDATAALEKVLDELGPLLEREQVTLHRSLFRPANFIETAVGNVQRDVLIGSVLVVGVLFVFLFNARTAFVSAVAIPLSLIAAVLMLQAFGVGLNIMVLGGLAIALGEVVDDAIIDCENIFRRLRERRGKPEAPPPWRIVLDASMEVRSSVVYATFIVALVFVPLITLSGVAGKLFAPLGLAYILAILSSLAVALTVTPALSLLMLGRVSLTAEDPPLIRWLKPHHERLLIRIERRPKVVMGVTALFLAIGVAALPFFSGTFIPPLREGHYIIHMTALPGTAEREMLRLGNRVTAAIRNVAGVKSVAQWVGRAQNGADTAGVHYSEFEVELGTLPAEEQERILREIRTALTGEEGNTGATRGGFPGVNFAVNTFLTERIEETVSGYASEVVINLFGPDLDALDRDAAAVAKVLATVTGARDVQVQSPPGSPQLVVRLRPDSLAARDMPATDVLDALQTAYQGAPVGTVYLAGQSTDVVVTLAPGEKRVDRVGALPLRTAPGTMSGSTSGAMIALREVADIDVAEGRYKIIHAGGKRAQSITCDVAGGNLEDFVGRARAAIAAKVSLGQGNYLTFAGTAEAQTKARSDLLVHSLLAGAGVLVLLYMAFGSARNMLLTLSNLPFALVGGVLAVLVTGAAVSVGSIVGFVTLFGITLRNAIMLVSHCRYLVETEGLAWNAQTAIRAALERLPSILMTALVTALGLLPLALGSGQPGREIEGPMATIIVGGLITSTLLNLLVLPTLLIHFGRFERKI
jgi:CzcA family heavy metal efflux pump